MKTDDTFFHEVENDRRKENRKNVTIQILIKMGNLINGRGITNNISMHGLYLKSLQIFKGNNIHSKDLAGSTVRVMIPSEHITINGSIAWVDLKTGEGAINIISTSDDNCWQKLCK